MKISILGYGTFGSAFASRLALSSHEILINEVKGSDIIIVSTPSNRVKEALFEHKNDITNQKIIICSKGLASNGDFISNVLKEEFPDGDVYFLYGPTLAGGLVDGDFSGMVLAGGEGKEEIKKALESESLKIELSNDIIGLQFGAVMKNVISILVGIVEGASYGQNTQAYVLTKSLGEVERVGVSLGAQRDTFTGLSFLGDLFLRSRNRTLGCEIGKGRKVPEVISEIKHVQEGINTIENYKIINKKLGIDLPYASLLHSILFENSDPKQIIEEFKKIK